MLAKICEGLTAICIIAGAAIFDGNSVMASILIFAGIVFLLLAKHEGGFREYEKDVDNSDVDLLIRKYRKR